MKAKLNIAPGGDRSNVEMARKRNSKPMENCIRETNFQGCFHRPRAVFSDIDSPSSPSSSFLQSLYFITDSNAFIDFLNKILRNFFEKNFLVLILLPL